MVGAVALKLPQILVHPLHDLVIILLRDGRIVQIPQGKLLGQDLKEHIVLIGHDGLVDAPLGKGTGGDQLSLIQLRQLGHAIFQAMGEYQALHMVIVPDAIVSPGGIEHPVADIYQIQQPPELLLRQFKLHTGTSLPFCFPVAFQYSRREEKLPLKKMGRRTIFSL